MEIPEAEPQISDEYSIQSAIGQGTNNYTVSQLNRYVAAVANRGTVYDLTLLDKDDRCGGKVLSKNMNLQVVDSTMDDISDEHMGSGTPGNGTAWLQAQPALTGLEITMAGKTGTAQQSDIACQTMHLFVGYAPAEQPQIVDCSPHYLWL